MSKSHGHDDADFEFAVRLLQEDLQTLQQNEPAHEHYDPRVPRSSRRGSRGGPPHSNRKKQVNNHNSEQQAQIQSDREFAERLSRGEDDFHVSHSKASVTNENGDFWVDENYPSHKVYKVPSKGSKRAVVPAVRSPVSPKAQKPAPSPPQSKGKTAKRKEGPPPRPPKTKVTVTESSKGHHGKASKEKSSKPCRPRRNPEEEISELKDLLQILAVSIGWTQDWQEDEATTSASASSKRYREEMSCICNICGDTYQNYSVFTLKCNHRYCVECLRDHIVHAFAQSGNELPRCCGEALPLVFAGEVLMENELNQLMDRRDAQESSKQVSCVHCKKDILQGSIKDNSAYCVDCSQFTCIHCGKELHDGVCPEDKDMAMLLETAKSQGWSRCGKCNNIVELSMGCFHMTCRCGHQFCYLCGVDWKKCECPTFSEQSVLGKIREATGKGAELLKQGWENSKAYVLNRQQLDEFKQQAVEHHREKMDLRQSLHRLREEKQLERQIAEQIILLRTEILELQGQVDHAEENRKKRNLREVEEGKVLGEQIVAKGLKSAAGKKAKKPSKKGKERARDVEGGDTKVIMAKIMHYVNT